MGHYFSNCDVCLANKYELWGRKRSIKTWPKRVKAVFRKLRKGESIDMLNISKEKSNA